MRNKTWKERLKLAFSILIDANVEKEIRQEEFMRGRGEVLGDYEKFRNEVIPFFKEWEERIQEYDKRGIGSSEHPTIVLKTILLPTRLVNFDGGIAQTDELSMVPPPHLTGNEILKQNFLSIQLNRSCWCYDEIKAVKHEAVHRLAETLLELNYLKYDIRENRGRFVITFYISTYNV